MRYKYHSTQALIERRLRDWPNDARQPAEMHGANSCGIMFREIRGGDTHTPSFPWKEGFDMSGSLESEKRKGVGKP
ncbi:hypothetical protein GCM10025857_35680 [Alicyclobacillus contaminans]|nr:hypothetical protein GCM10025857_35680 [Alicyclobacillus contaminans]